MSISRSGSLRLVIVRERTRRAGALSLLSVEGREKSMDERIAQWFEHARPIPIMKVYYTSQRGGLDHAHAIE